jgi:hypothetical protein
VIGAVLLVGIYRLTSRVFDLYFFCVEKFIVLIFSSTKFENTMSFFVLKKVLSYGEIIQGTVSEYCEWGRWAQGPAEPWSRE